MPTIQAIYQDGVFRPTTPVDLPEGCEVTVEPRGIDDPSPKSQPRSADPRADDGEPGWERIYGLLSHRYDGGQSDGAARHDEHQP